MLENLREWIENLKCWENWVQNLCFWKTFHLILMHFIHNIQCFEEFLHKTSLFFQNFVFFQNFDRLNLFRSIEIVIKNFGHPLSVLINARLILDQSKHFRSIEPNFWSIKNRMESFLTLDSHVFKHYFKKFSNSFSLYPISQGSNQDFLSFSSVLFSRFFSFKASKTLLPFLLHLFSCFMH